MAPPRVDPWTRFMAKVRSDTSGCWIWQGSVGHQGYARFWTGDRTAAAHRWGWEQLNGPVSEAMQLDHLCRVRNCVNPDHLEMVTARENVMRGNTIVAANAAKTHCDHGHALDLINTYICPRGKRECRTCRRAASRRAQLKRVS